MIKRLAFFICALFILSSCDQSSEDQKTDSTGNWYDALPRPSWSKLEQVSTNQNWFEVYKISDNTFAIYEPKQWQEVISYLLIGNDKALLVDTGMGIGDLKSVIDNLTDLPVIVINTHTHYDHVGSNHQFDTIYGLDTDFSNTNAKGHPHSDFVTMNDGEPVNSVGMDTIWKDLPDGVSLDEYESKAFNIDHFVKDGDQIDLGGRAIEVISIPGHTPDSIALLDKNNKYLLTGDSFYLAPIYVRSEEANFTDYFLTTQIMFSLRNNVEYLLPGHNETMQGSEYLNKLRAAAMAVINPDTPYKQAPGTRSYDFGDFGIIVKDPLDFGITAN